MAPKGEGGKTITPGEKQTDKHPVQRQATIRSFEREREHIKTTVPQQHHKQPRVCGKADTTHSLTGETTQDAGGNKKSKRSRTK